MNRKGEQPFGFSTLRYAERYPLGREAIRRVLSGKLPTQKPTVRILLQKSRLVL
jgi:hypothetical protein